MIDRELALIALTAFAVFLAVVGAIILCVSNHIPATAAEGVFTAVVGIGGVALGRLGGPRPGNGS